MRILLTGSSGYIGSNLSPLLTAAGHDVLPLSRNGKGGIQADLLNPETLKSLPKEIDAAYYLVHSMRESPSGFSENEARSALNFRQALEKTNCKQIIYLSGLICSDELSEHLASRKRVEEILHDGPIPLTTLRAGIIIGSGSASFEIMRDLVEKLPIMIAPKWVLSKCQPIAIDDVLFYLQAVLDNKKTLDHVLEIGGDEQITYREMLLRLAKMRGLKRLIIQVPVLTPKLSSYWLFFITRTSFNLARALVDSLKLDAICHTKPPIAHQTLSYEEALKRAFDIKQVPTHGIMQETIEVAYRNRSQSIEKLWCIGGKNGWYYMDWAWKLRGLFDKISGGKKMYRTHPKELHPGDKLDFWRVLIADKDAGHLLLHSEMIHPGEAWLEYHISDGTVKQTATFRPTGLIGRFYWYGLIPIHHFIFRGLCNAIGKA